MTILSAILLFIFCIVLSRMVIGFGLSVVAGIFGGKKYSIFSLSTTRKYTLSFPATKIIVKLSGIFFKDSPAIPLIKVLLCFF